MDELSVEVRDLAILSERTSDLAVITVGGDLGITTANRLEDELQRAEATGVGEILLDLRNLDFIDTTGVRVLIAASRRSRDGGDRLRIIRGSAPIQRVLASHGQAELLPFVD
jgi:anti-anti-sigma factor